MWQASPDLAIHSPANFWIPRPLLRNRSPPYTPKVVLSVFVASGTPKCVLFSNLFLRELKLEELADSSLDVFEFAHHT